MESFEQFLEEIIRTYEENEHDYGNLTYERVDENVFFIRLRVPKFIIKNRDGYFAFSEASIGTRLVRKGKYVMITELPKVVDKGFRHPGVWDDGQIDFPFYNSNFYPEEFYLESQELYEWNEDTAFRIASMFGLSKETIEFYDSEVPVYPLKDLGCEVDKHYAKREEIPKSRVFKTA
ncbi:hypothetical protein D6745_01215 [Candidatus Woesearchaeota archaeon]|nr:MAG: hypothetical protein D6745_01215 [Candidatus Woesearchaeota archaeon]